MAAPTLDPLTTQALASLREMALPPEVAYVPRTIGWVGVALALAAVVAWWAWRRHRRWVANRYRRDALAELAAIEQRLAAEDGGSAVSDARAAAVAALPALLKRTALACEPRPEVAALSEDAWLAYLDRTCPPGGFASRPGRTLAQLAYADGAAVSADDLRTVVDLVRHWIREHDAHL